MFFHTFFDIGLYAMVKVTQTVLYLMAEKAVNGIMNETLI